MEANQNTNVVCESLDPHVRVLRFARPDLRSELDDWGGIIEDCTLYREVYSQALADLKKGETLIVNLGLIDRFPTVFYSLLLKIRETVQARNARLLLCCLPPNVREGFDLLGSGKLFEVTATESQAAYEVHN